MDALGAVVGLRGVLQQADIPDVSCSETADIGEGFGSEVTELPRAILGECAMGLAGRILIPPESSEGGVDDDLLLHRCRRVVGLRLFRALLLFDQRGELSFGQLVAYLHQLLGSADLKHPELHYLARLKEIITGCTVRGGILAED